MPDKGIIDWFAATQRQRPKHGLLGRLSPAQRDKNSKPEALPERFIYCPLQVAADTQLTIHGGWVRDMPTFINAVTEAAQVPCPATYRGVLPASVLRGRTGRSPAARRGIQSDRVPVIAGGTSAALLARSAAVVTVNSSVGLKPSPTIAPW